jgi:hypothetical protein
MALSVCLWCDMPVKQGISCCPECGYRNPIAEKHVSRPKPVRRLLLGLVVLPLMLSGAYAAMLPSRTSIALTNTVQVAAVVPQAKIAYVDPVQQAVWADGQRSLVQALGTAGGTTLRHSFLSLSAGHYMTVCGVVAGTNGYASDTGEQRYLSIFGQQSKTLVERQDSASFGVLWTRLCQGPHAAV